MAYGKGKAKKDWQRRAIPLGIGEISRARHDAFMQLRKRIQALAVSMAEAGFDAEPLRTDRRDKALDAALLPIQVAAKPLNSVWREQARLQVKPKLEEANRRYFARLSGALRFVDKRIPEHERTQGDERRWYQVPVAVQDAISPEELATLKRIGEAGGAIDLFRDWLDGHDSLSPTQRAVLADIHARAQRRHRCPDFGRADVVLALNVSAKMLSDSATAQALRDGAAYLLADDANAVYYRFLDLAGIEARGERLKLPLALSRKMAERIDDSVDDYAAITVELGPDAISVRLIVAKATAPMPTTARAFVGRDFGYTNTVSLSVAVADEAIDLAELQRTLDTLEGKDAVAQYLRTHALADVRVVERVRFAGHRFLDRVKTLAARIDGYKSRIDLAYNRLAAIRAGLVADLQLAEGERITPAMKALSPQAGDFFGVLGQIRDLKRSRQRLYDKIVAIKKAWFGYLSNVELTLAKKYQAAIVREDLDIVTIEKAAPAYKGRAFNKMLNHGAKGQYRRRATDKFRWHGVPEIVAPSEYSSRYCGVHAHIVDEAQRRGEQIYFPCCNRHDHADEHAGDTLACYPFLRPKLVEGRQPLPRYL